MQCLPPALLRPSCWNACRGITILVQAGKMLNGQAAFKGLRRRGCISNVKRAAAQWKSIGGVWCAVSELKQVWMQIRGSQGWFLSLNRWAQDWHFNSVSLVFEIDSLKPPSLTPCVLKTSLCLMTVSLVTGFKKSTSCRRILRVCCTEHSARRWLKSPSLWCLNLWCAVEV